MAVNYGPNRYDVVGSFLRPEALKQARADFAADVIDEAALRAVEDEAIRDLVAKQKAAGLRVVTDLRGEKINYKIRELTLQKVPYIAVVGDKEKADGTVSIRARGGRNLGVMPLQAFIDRVVDEDKRRVNKDE